MPVVPPKQASAPLHSEGLLGPPIHRITSNEAKEQREKGLCYYYDKKFIPGHRCQRPQLFMIEEPSIPTHMNDQDLDKELDALHNYLEFCFMRSQGRHTRKRYTWWENYRINQ